MIYLKSNKFPAYFAGLLEGNGSFVVSSIPDKNTKLSQSGQVNLAFRINDRPLAEHLRDEYGGHLTELLKSDCILWSITKTENILRVSSCVNGFLRTPKIHDFKNLVAFIKEQDSSISLDVLPLDDSSIGSNAWFSGFCDAESEFRLQILNKRHKKNAGEEKKADEAQKNCEKTAKLLFHLPVKQCYNPSLTSSSSISSFIPICSTIGEFFKTKHRQEILETKSYKISITTGSKKSTTKLIDYFDKFPLCCSSKNAAYRNWKEIQKQMQEKRSGEYLTPEELTLCETTKQQLKETKSSNAWKKYRSNILHGII